MCVKTIANTGTSHTSHNIRKENTQIIPEVLRIYQQVLHISPPTSSSSREPSVAHAIT